MAPSEELLNLAVGSLSIPMSYRLCRGDRGARPTPESEELSIVDTDRRDIWWTEYVLGAPGNSIAGDSEEIQGKMLAEQVLGLARRTRIGRRTMARKLTLRTLNAGRGAH